MCIKVEDEIRLGKMGLVEFGSRFVIETKVDIEMGVEAKDVRLGILQDMEEKQLYHLLIGVVEMENPHKFR